MSILTKQFLLKEYQQLGKSLREISNETGIRAVTIGKALNKFKIPNKLCAISKVPIKFKINYKDEQTASLDRIDSSKPYVISNIHWVHKKVNTMKWNISQNEFIQWCKIISENN